MPALIVTQRGRERERRYAIRGALTSLGRHHENDVELPSPAVSRHHAQIVREHEDFYLIDLGSPNGTQLNGHTVTPREKHLLRSGDIITIDLFDMHFSQQPADAAEAVEEEITESDIMEVRLLKKVLSALDRETAPSIEVLNGSHEGKRFFLNDESTEFIVGREIDCAISIPEPVISRRHAKIVKRWGSISLHDLDSKNGTFLNNRQITEETLHDGDRIAFGTIVVIFRNPQEINLAHIEAMTPKRKPAPLAPQDVPLTEELEEIAAAETPEDVPEEDSSSAPQEWNHVQSEHSAPEDYPAPHAPTADERLSLTEMGMLGLGVLILLITLIGLINVLLF